jgi:hypothetical protein
MDDLDLHAEANEIRREFDAANTAGRTRLEHGIAAGFRLLKVDEYLKRGPRQKGGFRDWLRQHGFNKADAYDFMLLARNAETARNSGRSSIHATLQTLRAKVGNSGKSKKSGASGSPLSKAAWTKATVQERQEFLDTIGADSICTALSYLPNSSAASPTNNERQPRHSERRSQRYPPGAVATEGCEAKGHAGRGYREQVRRPPDASTRFTEGPSGIVVGPASAIMAVADWH